MKGEIFQGSPPGYLTIAEACQALGMSRQNFHQSGLADALDRWQVSQATTLYRREDIGQLRHWLFVRRGLIALELRPANYPLNPDSGEYHLAVEEGYWDTYCPNCDGEAVGEPLDERCWCPECGINIGM